MPRSTIVLLTCVAMLAFAGNSLLCRLALREGAIDAATFTAIRIIAGAMTLWLIVRLRTPRAEMLGSWTSAAALFVYAIAFSFAYIQLSAGTGALLLFGAVQVTMIGFGLIKGERFTGLQWLGFAAAIIGLLGLLYPGLSAPPAISASLMLAAGVAWGVYSIGGRGAGDPTLLTAGNFARAVPFAVVAALIGLSDRSYSNDGVMYAVASGAITSGVGYAIWYAVVRHMPATIAATVQLSVPVITAIAGVLLLQESITARLVFASLAVLGGIAVVILKRRAS